MFHFKKIFLTVFAVFAFSAFGLASNAYADEEITIVIKDHKFEPSDVMVPAGERIRLVVVNEDVTPEEFESHDLNLEKIIAGGRKGTFVFGPLEPGEYVFFGEFNMDTAQGRIIAE